MATKCHLVKNEIVKRLICDSDSDCWTEEAEHVLDREFEDEEDEPQHPPPPPPNQSSSSSSSWEPPQHYGRRSVNNFSCGAVGIKLSEAPHVNKDSTPLCIFMLYFSEIIHLLVGETNQYCLQYLNKLEDGPSPLLDVTDSEMFLFLGIIGQMGHYIRDRVKDYWSTTEQFLTKFYSNAMKCDRFLHFTDNNADIDKQADNYD
jgi:hypothetical protein